MAKLAITKDVALPFLAGLVVAPFVKPMLRGAIKAAVGVSLRMKVLASEASKELHGMAAEVTAEVLAASAATPPSSPAPPGS